MRFTRVLPTLSINLNIPVAFETIKVLGITIQGDLASIKQEAFCFGVRDLDLVSIYTNYVDLKAVQSTQSLSGTVP